MIHSRRYLPSRSIFAYGTALALQASISLTSFSTIAGEVVAPSVVGTDALAQSAIKSALVNYSLLMDIDRVGDTLVAVGERGHILISSDEAASWTQVDVPVRVTLTASFFINEQLGWAVGHDGVVLRTNDGGTSWTKLLDGNQANQLMLTRAKALLADAQVALENAQLAPVDSQDDAHIEALELTLEDADMFLGDAESFVDEGPTRPFLDVWFNNEKDGFIVGAFGLMLRTHDGGNNWTPWFEGLDNPDLFHLNAIKPIHGKLYIAAEAGNLYRSDDEGEHWTLLGSPYEGSFFGVVSSGIEGSGISGSSEQGVIAYGLRGNAFISHDEGQTWNKLNTGVDASLFAATSLTDGSVVLVGAGGMMLTFNAVGELINSQQHPRKFPLSAVLERKVAGKPSGIFTAGFGGIRQVDTLKPQQTMVQQSMAQESSHE